jgi:hypothetical protein
MADELPENVTLDWIGRRLIALQSDVLATREDIRTVHLQLRRIEDRMDRTDETLLRLL